MNQTHVSGNVSDGFEQVADAFADNFAQRGDVAASCAIYLDGQLVVDLWGGATHAGQWSPEARGTVFSVSKGVTTICLLMAVDRGLLELDRRVAEYWPEFAQNGKAETTVRQILAHRGGLPAPACDLTVDDLRAWTPVATELARQAPAWQPGVTYMYHPFTFGTLAGEILHRATGLRPDGWLREHVLPQLQLTMSFGAKPGTPNIIGPLEPIPGPGPAAENEEQWMSLDIVIRSLTLGRAFDRYHLYEEVNRPDTLDLELPGANLITNARDLARLYAATIGEVQGVRLVSDETLTDAVRVQSEGIDFLGMDSGSRWGTGFMLDCERRGMAGRGSFGHDGMGGQLAFAHAERRISFAYHTARPSNDPADQRAEELSRALRNSL